MQKAPEELYSVYPKWWVDAVARRVEGEPLDQLAAKLTAHARLAKPNHRTTLSDFLVGKSSSSAVMLAFCSMFPDLPPPLLRPRSYEEAHRLHQIAQAYAPVSPPTTVADGTPQSVDTSAIRQGARPSRRGR